MANGTLHTSDDKEIIAAGDLDVEIRDEDVDKIMKKGGEIGRSSNTFDVTVRRIPGDRLARRRYAALAFLNVRHGPVNVVEPNAGGDAFPVKVGDLLRIKVSHG